MKTLIAVAAATALLAGVSVANAQSATPNPETTKQNSGNIGKSEPGSMNKDSMKKSSMKKKKSTTGSGMSGSSMSPGSTPADKNNGPTGNESSKKIPDTKAK
ncbi:MAG TPA: hypothetical protein VHD14_10645 [Pseudolabrys sp.]|jgi:pentapeptide MXKDX repeat protein|nr:hypothetical protein [Pseudolabrys sp.]